MSNKNKPIYLEDIFGDTHLTLEEMEKLEALSFEEEVALRKHNKKCYPVMFNPKCKYLRLGYSWYAMHLTPFESKIFHLIQKPWYTKELHKEVQKVLKEYSIELPSMQVIYNTWGYEV